MGGRRSKRRSTACLRRGLDDTVLARLAAAAGARGGARRRRRVRSGDRRWRSQRALGRAAGKGGRAGAGGGPARARPSRTRPVAATAASSSPRSRTGSTTAWPVPETDMGNLERLGLENFDSVVATIGRHGIDCDLELTEISTSPSRRTRSPGLPTRSRRCGHTVTRQSCSIASRSGPRSTRRSTRRGAGNAAVPGCSTRRSSAGGSPLRRARSAFGFTSAPR